MNEEETLKEIIKNKDVKFLAKHKFNFDLSQGQVDIVRSIVFKEHKRLCISAMTRYGKSQCVAIAIAIMIDLSDHEPIKVAFIGPGEEQAQILRQYLSELIMKDEDLRAKAHLSTGGEGKILKEASRKRMTFSNMCEYKVFSAEGEAKRLMGFGADIVVKDESCLISRKAHVKIMRMLGDNPKNGILIELYNPWDTDNVTYDHTLNPRYHVIQINWKQAVREGRTTIEFVMEQKEDLEPIEFTVLYESAFPDQPEDALFSLSKVKAAETIMFSFEEELKELEYKLDHAHKFSEKEIRKAREEMKQFTRIVACDPAEKGLDETVVYFFTAKKNKFQMVKYFSEAKSEPMQLAGKVYDWAVAFIGKKVKGFINFDRIGIGSGPISRVKHLVRDSSHKNIHVKGCHFGESATKKDIFHNLKCENYFRLRDLMDEGMIDISVHKKLRKQLLSMKWERSSTNKKKILDPSDSPDWADALVYVIWKDSNSLISDWL